MAFPILKRRFAERLKARKYRILKIPDQDERDETG